MVRFVTNTTKESKRDLLERLKKLEFDISEDEIFTSLTAARNLVEQKQVRPMLLVHDRALADFKGRGNCKDFKIGSSYLLINHSLTEYLDVFIQFSSYYIERVNRSLESKLVFLKPVLTSLHSK